MRDKPLQFFNKRPAKILLYWILFWVLQSVLMSGGREVGVYLLKNTAIVGLQFVVVYVNLKVLFPYFFQQKRYVSYVVLSIVLIYLVYSVSFFFIDFALSFQSLPFLGDFQFQTDFWRILSGSSFYSLALVCSTIYKLLSINRRIESEMLEMQKEYTEETICVKEGSKSHFIHIDSIQFIKGLREYVVWNTEDKKIISLDSLKRIEAELEPKGFKRVHKSYIINTKKINSLTRSSIEIGKETIPIGRKYKDNF